MTAALKKQRRQHLSTLHWAECDETPCNGWRSPASADIGDAKHAAVKHDGTCHPETVVRRRG